MALSINDYSENRMKEWGNGQLGLHLIRKEVTDEFVSGELILYSSDGSELFRCYTIERPWEDNKPYVSCIPPKPYEREEYEVDVLESSPAFNYKHLWIRGVPNRTVIKVHIANRAPELNGCIAPGLDYSNGQVLRSGDAMKELMSYFKVGDKTRILVSYL